MASQVTVTAKTGPALQATAMVLGDVQNINFDLARRVVQVFQPVLNTQPKEFDLTGVTTITFSISGANYTMVIS